MGTDTGAHSPAGSFLALWLNGAVRQNHLLKLPEAGPYSSDSAGGGWSPEIGLSARSQVSCVCLGKLRLSRAAWPFPLNSR